MLRHRPFILGWVALVASVVHGGEGQWSRFRGPNGSGISSATTIPVKWTDKDYRWRVELPGIGWNGMFPVFATAPSELTTLIVRFGIGLPSPSCMARSR